MRDCGETPSPTIGASPQTGNGKFPPSLVEAETVLRYGNAAPFDAKGKEIPLDGPCPSVLGLNQMHNGHQFILEGAGSETDITRYAIGAEWDKLKPGEQSDKYRSLIKADPDKPSPTILQRGGDGGVATVTHPVERRKFTIVELRRICAFPDDFVLTGTYAQQWERLGRSVPPVMMSHVAAVIRDEVLNDR
jgi:DNA (cytosine-5)-methyltransferase 1